MNVEGLEAVKARIEEIRRRFVDAGLQPPPVGTAATPGSFEDAMRRTSASRFVPCPADMESMIGDAAARYGLDPAMVKAVVRVESGFNPRATSPVGAQGLMQLMPGTARALGVDPADPAQNIDGGARYLKQQVDRFGSLDLALAAYNAGPGNVTKYGGVPPFDETRRYVSEVLRQMQNYSLDE